MQRFPDSQAITSFVLKPKTTVLIAYENSAFMTLVKFQSATYEESRSKP